MAGPIDWKQAPKGARWWAVDANGDAHPVMKHMHKQGDEKRSVVILRPADYDEWLHTKNVDAARAMPQLYSADEMVAEAAPKS